MITIETSITYLTRVLPGLAVIAAVFLVVRPSAVTRVGLYILAFVLLRDAMTPLGLWQFSAREGVHLFVRSPGGAIFLLSSGLI